MTKSWVKKPKFKLENNKNKQCTCNEALIGKLRKEINCKNDEVPGLAVSRSIGDIVAHEVGVSCEPEIFEKELDSDDHFIVIGSDGIWDAMSSCEVVGFIFQKMESQKSKCAQLLAEECRNRWELLNMYKQKYLMEMDINQDQNKSRSSKNNIIDIDDITCIIDFLNIEKDEY